MQVAIDGYAGSGKSTIAKKISEELDYLYIDTGAMYRMITLYYLQNNLDVEKDISLEELNNIDINMTNDNFFLNTKEVTNEIRNIEVSDNVSKVASHKNVREVLVDKQRNLSIDKNVVLDGRDIGTVVFPKAQVKIYLVASPEIRAKRRMYQLGKMGIEASYEELLNNIVSRDQIDTTRKISPLTKANDAIEIDSGDLTEDEVYKKVKDIILKNINKNEI